MLELANFSHFYLIFAIPLNPVESEILGYYLTTSSWQWPKRRGENRDMVVYKRRHPTIGVIACWQVYTSTMDTYLEYVFHGIQTAAHDSKCNVLFSCGMNATSFASQSRRPAGPIHCDKIDFIPVGPWNCDGLIVVPILSIEEERRYFLELVEQGYPVIYAGTGDYSPQIVPDNAGGIRQAMQHLYEHGHRQIAFIAGFDNEPSGDSELRLQAYRNELERLGIPCNPDLIVHGYHGYHGGQDAMRQLLQHCATFSAVLASNDRSALGALQAIQEAGLTIPNDIALIGFDDRLEAHAQDRPLTTIHLPMYELGYQAVALLLKTMKGQVPCEETVYVPTQLVIRESCGCLPMDKGRLIGGYGAHKTHSYVSLADTKIQPAAKVPPLIRAKNLSIKELIALNIHMEAHSTNREDIDRLTKHLVDSYRESLEHSSPSIFLENLQQILVSVARHGDVNAWQPAITALREELAHIPQTRFDLSEAKEMLDQARVMISEAARAQTIRRSLRQGQVAQQLGEMTSHFFMAEDEDEIFSALQEDVKSIGIEHATVVYYLPEQDDPAAYSLLQSPHTLFPKGYRFDTYQFPPDGLYAEDHPFCLALLPLAVGGTLCGYVALDVGPFEVFAQITHQVASSLHAIRLRLEALEGRRLAEEANRLKSRLLSVVSHELRAPLSLIIGLSDMLIQTEGSSGEMAGDFSKDLERIRISAQHLDGLLQDVLDLTRSDIHQLQIIREPLNLADLLDSIAPIGEHLTHNKGLTWCYKRAQDLPLVLGSPTRLRQVILNLINNAVKFTTYGEVVLSAAVENHQVAISVRDTGLGIPLSEQEVIFEEFQQSKKSAVRGYGGLGLGLAICKRLVEMHGGEIRVCSSGAEDQGAVFTFTLPAMMATTELPKDMGIHAPKALLCVKNRDGGAVLQEKLSAKGYQIELHVLEDDDDWADLILQTMPDAVVIDSVLTSERGWDILQILKENPVTQNVPMMFYTLNQDGNSGSLLELDCLTKPLMDAFLNEAILPYQEAIREVKEASILIVDDDPEIVSLNMRMLHKEIPQARILQAFDGHKALALIRQERPRLVLLDLMMPEMDGFSVLEAIQADENIRGTPVIVITGQSLDEESMARLNRGVVNVLNKGVFSLEEMLQHIAASLEHRQRSGVEVQRVILKAVAFIHTRYNETISRQDVAQHVGLSERHLDRCFRRKLGISPMTYLNRYRVHQACLLLEQGELGITEVALEVGFSSGSYFSRVFRSEVGVSPRGYLQDSGH